MLLFQRLQFPEQLIELGIGNFRAVQHVIQIIVVVDLITQFLDAFDCVLVLVFLRHNWFCYGINGSTTDFVF